MTTKQKIFYSILLIIWLLLMIWEFSIGEYERIIKPNSAIVLFGSEPFTSLLSSMISPPKMKKRNHELHQQNLLTPLHKWYSYHL